MITMKETSRSQNSIRNTVYGITTQVLTVLISFITRTVFIKYLSVEYLGVNGLFTNILTVLSLAELGFGGAMVYSMYQPLAIKDYKVLKALMHFYSKIGGVLATDLAEEITRLHEIFKHPRNRWPLLSGGYEDLIQKREKR